MWITLKESPAKDLAITLDANSDLTTGGAAEVSLRAAATAALEDMAWLPVEDT